MDIGIESAANILCGADPAKHGQRIAPCGVRDIIDSIYIFEVNLL